MNKIFCGDCNVLLDQLDENSVDMVLFSPPYDQQRDYNGFSLDLNVLGKKLLRVIKDGGVCCCIINDGTKDFAKSLTSFRLAVNWVDNGWKLFETCIYSRHGRPGGWWNQRFRVDHEYIFIFFKGDRPKSFDKSHLMVPTKTPNAVWHGTDRMSDGSLKKIVNARSNLEKCRGTVWKYNTSNTESNSLKSEHPATMPDLLACDLIRCFTKEGDIVLDPTVGSGTTTVMARKLNRQFIGMDVSDKYVEIANKRLQVEIREEIL